MTSGEHEVFLESSVRGYHAYFKYSTVSVGELMMCEIEENIDHDLSLQQRVEFGWHCWPIVLTYKKTSFPVRH